MSKINEIILSLVEWFICDLPGAIGRKVRYSYYKRRLHSIGSNVIFDCGIKIHNPKFVKIGDNTWIDHNVVILAGAPNASGKTFRRKNNNFSTVKEGNVDIGKNCHIAIGVVLQGHGGLQVGDDSGIASGCSVYSMSHHYRNANDRTDNTIYKFSPMSPPEEQSLISAAVVIGNYTALGLNSVVLPGAVIGDEAWVASGSVVTGKVESRSVVGGNPLALITHMNR